MKHKKVPVKKQNQKEQTKTRKTDFSKNPIWVIWVLVISILINVVFLTLQFLPKRNNQKELEYALSKAAFTVMKETTLRDEENVSFRIKFGELWDNRLQRMSGYVAEFPLNHFPPCSVILDSDLQIISIGSLKEVSLAGTNYYLGDYFSKLYGLNIERLAGNAGVFKPNDKELEVYAEEFKASLLKTMKMAYLRVNGAEEFNKLFPNGMNMASVGDYLKKFQAVDSNGKNVNINSLQDRKNAIIYVDMGCGSCKSKCASMRDLLSAGDINVIFISDGNAEETKSFITEYTKGETVISDPDRKLANLLYMSEPPYLMLIEKNLKIVFKESIDDVVKDAEPAITSFIK